MKIIVKIIVKIIEKIKRFLHNFLGWGFPKEMISPDSFQSTYSCKYCDKTLAQDSTGAWFHLEDYSEFADKLVKEEEEKEIPIMQVTDGGFTHWVADTHIEEYPKEPTQETIEERWLEVKEAIENLTREDLFTWLQDVLVFPEWEDTPEARFRIIESEKQKSYEDGQRNGDLRCYIEVEDWLFGKGDVRDGTITIETKKLVDYFRKYLKLSKIKEE